MARKIAILGTAPGWEDAPFDDRSWKIWGISRLYNYIPRWDQWFELHRPDEICETWAAGDKTTEASHRQVYLEWLREQDIPVWVQDGAQQVIPKGEAFPFGDIQKWAAKWNTHGPDATDDVEKYFTNTVSWLLGFALMRADQEGDVDEIGVWGVDMAMDSEFGEQRPSCEYFIGLGRGLGIPVHIPRRSDLLKVLVPYALQHAHDFLHKVRHKKIELLDRKGQVTEEMKKLRAALTMLNGQLQLVQYQEEKGVVTPEKAAEMRQVLEEDGERFEAKTREGEQVLASVHGNLEMLEYQQRNWFPDG